MAITTNWYGKPKTPVKTPTYRSNIYEPGAEERSNVSAAKALTAGGYAPTHPNIADYRTQNIANLTTQMRSNAQPTAASRTVAPVRVGSGGGGGGRGGGGGGGGGAAAPTMTQAQLDWAASLLGGARPGALTANTLDLPDYQGMAVRAFDPAMFNQARTALNQGVEADIGTANTATQNMLGFLNQNYTNAFNNPNATYATAGQAPGMSGQAMGRFLQGQGVNPQLAAQTQAEGVQADQAFGNMWRSQAANEDIMQRARLGNAQQYGTQANQAITAAGRAGNLGIDLGQGQAQAAWQQRADERAYQDYQQQQQIAQQEAMQNWQRANQVQDVNYQTTNQYKNSEMEALLGLLPQLIQNPNLQLPGLAALGMG